MLYERSQWLQYDESHGAQSQTSNYDQYSFIWFKMSEIEAITDVVSKHNTWMTF